MSESEWCVGAGGDAGLGGDRVNLDLCIVKTECLGERLWEGGHAYTVYIYVCIICPKLDMYACVCVIVS